MDDWLTALLFALDDGERALLGVLAALGLADEVRGQPAWPWSWRLAIETLAIDRALARALLQTVAALMAAVALGAVAIVWRRARAVFGSLAVAALLIAPWADPSLLLAPAVPTSFHRSPTAFSATAIVEGGRLFAEHCASCHGAQARGDGPRAGGGPTWPPDLTRGLLWRRADGELLWRVLHGVRDARRGETMPGFGWSLSTAQTWALVDWLHAQAAGVSLARDGQWAWPVRLPDAAVRCADAPPTTLRALTGQRVRLVAGVATPVAGGPGAAREDPRVVTVRVLPPGTATTSADDGCRADDAALWRALATLAGVPPERLAGMQFLADRDGWARARVPADAADWSADALVCRPGEVAGGSSGSRGAADGLGLLIARMDAAPVRLLKGVSIH